ncbi:MAG TPA: YraN family protein [Candidatus Bathyarchaeia archaeon]|nr:YraN family protein [Candidatus Bathyarchaeia archaeon]
MDGNVSRGGIGERIAALYLELAGCTILERNFRFEHLEIDLIVRDGPCIAFVEVKTRGGVSFGAAREAVGRDKLRNVRKAARWYLVSRPGEARASEYRFDLVALDCDVRKGTMALEHIRGIA